MRQTSARIPVLYTPRTLCSSAPLAPDHCPAPSQVTYTRSLFCTIKIHCIYQIAVYNKHTVIATNTRLVNCCICCEFIFLQIHK